MTYINSKISYTIESTARMLIIAIKIRLSSDIIVLTTLHSSLYDKA